MSPVWRAEVTGRCCAGPDTGRDVVVRDVTSRPVECSPRGSTVTNRREVWPCSGWDRIGRMPYTQGASERRWRSRWRKAVPVHGAGAFTL